MNLFYKIALLSAAVTLCVASSCEENNPNKDAQKDAAKRAAASITFVDNAEIDNIKRRLELTSQPGLLGYILLMNEAGQPVAYLGVKGKITSGSKRLTPPDRYVVQGNGHIRAEASDEGTWGSSDPYIYFWTTDGAYVQWSGKYLYSDQPIRLKVEPLVVSVTGK